MLLYNPMFKCTKINLVVVLNTIFLEVSMSRYMTVEKEFRNRLASYQKLVSDKTTERRGRIMEPIPSHSL